MLESIIEIGGAVLEKVSEEKDKLSAHIQEVPYEKNGKKQHVCKFIFDTKNLIFDVDVSEEIDQDTAKKYLFIDSVGGPNSPQWYITSKGSSYILSELFPNLKERGLFKDIVEIIIDNFYWRSPVDLGGKKYAYMLNIEKLGVSTKTMNDLLSETVKTNEPGKKMRDLVKKEIKDWILKKYGVNENEIGLYTVVVDGFLLTDDENYRNEVLKSKSAATTDTKKKKSKKSHIGLECNVCGSKENISQELDKMKIKYFTTNQIIFKGNLETYAKSLNLCSSCIEKLQAGEVFVQNNLATNIAGFNVYVIPNLIYGQKLDAEKMGNLCKNLINTVNMARNIDEIKKFREQIERLQYFDDIVYLLDFAFVRITQASTKILRLIKDVKPSFFEFFEKATAEIKTKVDYHFQGRYKYYGGLNSIYYMTPVKFKEGKNASYRDLLALYDAIFLGQEVDKRYIISNLVNGIGIVFYEQEGYNIRTAKKNLHYFILDAMFYLEFLEKMGCMKGGDKVDYSDLGLADELKNFMEDMKYDETQAAMFLLGYLVGEVGNAQYRRSKENNSEGTYKPVLNKINFNGIDKSKIMRLRSEIFNKLRQEKILQYNEKIYAACTKLMDRNIKNWKLNKDENLFYLLSGYAYATTAPMKKKGEEDDNE
ncbi:MAG: TIGR02556 family CRISPR-associated protein [Clostridia bacterium]|nr:TIGR02556 family CRISPR-associated protein [Clostridia bacterium]